jgi:peptide deformylase
MEIVKNHFNPGRVVKSYKDIAAIVDEMIPFVDGGVDNGEYNSAFAISHSQVSDDPWAFFVVNSKFIERPWKKGNYWPAHAIINPQILEASDKIIIGKIGRPGIDERDDVRQNVRTYQEGCFSFPFRKPKNVRRYYKIKVRYQIKAWYGLKTITEEIEGLRAHIFQHEFQHSIGENIYIPKK